MRENFERLFLHLHLSFEYVDQVLRRDHELPGAVFFGCLKILRQALRGEAPRHVRLQFV